MTRPTRIEIDTAAIRHNIALIKSYAPNQQVIAMVKADAYGCGVPVVIPVLDQDVDAFGVACLEEAKRVRSYTQKPCILFQGVFSPDELYAVVQNQFEVVVHQRMQLNWLLETRLAESVRVWVKVDTGMHRLGFPPDEIYDVIIALKRCRWVHENIGIMTHLASADQPKNAQNQTQADVFRKISLPEGIFTQSVANSAAILSNPDILFDAVRPGIMLYGVSPFLDMDGVSIGLKPVMHFISAITAIQTCLPGESVGYGATWQANRCSRIGIVAVGYGDGYPRHIARDTSAYINGYHVPIVGRVSMDTLAVDLTDYPAIHYGDRVELWGANLPVERIARAAGTSAYELICQVSPRVRAQATIV